MTTGYLDLSQEQWRTAYAGASSAVVLRSPEWWNGGLPITNLKLWPAPITTKTNLAEQVAAHQAETAAAESAATSPAAGVGAGVVLLALLAYFFWS